MNADANCPTLQIRLLMLWTKTAFNKVLYRADAFRVRPIRLIFVVDVGYPGPVETIINETRVARASWSCVYIIIMKSEYEFDRY